jgi:hypothetical protein
MEPGDPVCLGRGGEWLAGLVLLSLTVGVRASLGQDSSTAGWTRCFGTLEACVLNLGYGVQLLWLVETISQSSAICEPAPGWCV